MVRLDLRQSLQMVFETKYYKNGDSVEMDKI